MAIIPKQGNPSPGFLQTVEEIMILYKTLPPRSPIEEIEAAISVINTVNFEEEVKLDEISKLEPLKDVPEELFYVLQQVKKNMVLFQSYEQRKEAINLVEVDKMLESFDELIQRASRLISGDTQIEKIDGVKDPIEKIAKRSVISDGSLMKNKKLDDRDLGKKEVKLQTSSSTKASIFSGGEDDKLSLMKVAAVIENTAKTGVGIVDLRGKLMDQIEWLPTSLGKLSHITSLDVSENRIMALPATMGSLRSLSKLDIHSNQVINLPDSFGELVNLTDLDLHANKLKSLPASFQNLRNLINLDLSSNHFVQLPDSIGNLSSLKTLIAETNELEELPYTIGNCSSLVELRLDFNQLKALPEAVGKLHSLEILTVHYNRIKGLPTTMGNLVNLKELDLSFNEIDNIPENFCFAVNLRKLNAGKNFADLRALPRSIGNLELLEELDISDCQIRVLPDSFRFLSKLTVFRADETPLEVPPRQITKLGAQAVVQYMEELVSKKNVKSLPTKQKKGFWAKIFSILWPCRGNH